MPTYDYICENCAHDFEHFQSITAKSLRKCPECGKMTLKRLIGIGSGVIFKGSGFYQTDYRSESYKKAEKSEKPATDKGTSEKKAESKDAKPTEKPKATKKDKKKTA
ncbi:MAG: FmdB family zinc ribbon protein [Planctomycetota bacterium]